MSEAYPPKSRHERTLDCPVSFVVLLDFGYLIQVLLDSPQKRKLRVQFREDFLDVKRYLSNIEVCQSQVSEYILLGTDKIVHLAEA